MTVLLGTVPVGSVVRVTCTSLSEVVSVKSAMTVLLGVVSVMFQITCLPGITLVRSVFVLSEIGHCKLFWIWLQWCY